VAQEQTWSGSEKLLLRLVMGAVQLALWFLSAEHPLFDTHLLGLPSGHLAVCCLKLNLVVRRDDALVGGNRCEPVGSHQKLNQLQVLLPEENGLQSRDQILDPSQKHRPSSVRAPEPSSLLTQLQAERRTELTYENPCSQHRLMKTKK
jgi:hypothetical protein